MREAMFWERAGEGRVKCSLCRFRCLISEGHRGVCGVRENRGGVLYTLVYVLPLFGIVLAFTLTMGSRKLTETEGRVLKLVSGLMMLCLGGVLLTRPEMLQRLGAAVAVLGVALALAAAMLLLFPPGGRRRP